MQWWILGIALICGWSIRLLVLGILLRNPESLWYDFEHRGTKYWTAWTVDIVTSLTFTALVLYSLYWLNALSAPLVVCFIGVLGMTSFSRLSISRFPRTNVPGAMSDAQASLITNLILSFGAALMSTVGVAIYLWLRR